MAHDGFHEGPNWLLSSRRRRLRIGDLMVAVVMTAIGLSAIMHSDMTARSTLLLALFAVGFLALLWAQWGLANISPKRPQTLWVASRGILSSILALAMFVVLIVVGLVVPQAAALLSVMMLIQVVYLTTWD